MASTLDWEQLKMAHLVWKINFRSLLNGGAGKLESVQVKDHTQCDMGKWLHGEGKLKYTGNPMYEDLVEYHKIFHEMATKAYNHYVDGQKQEAQVCLVKIGDHSNTMMEIMDQFKGVVAKEPEQKRSVEIEEAIVWKKEYEIGVSQIDDQHRSLVNIINQLWTGIKNKVANHQIAEIIYKLEDYTKVHFAAEEAMMEAVGYSGLAAHKQKHTDFIVYLSDYRKQVSNGSKDYMGLYEFLGKWLLNHIQKADRDYMDEINKKKQPIESGLFARIFRKL